MIKIIIRVFIPYLLLTVLPLHAASNDTENTESMVEKIIQAYGGPVSVAGVKVVKHTGTIKSYRLNKTGALERLFASPDQLRVDIKYPGGPHEQRITTAEGAWRDGRLAPVPMQTAMKLQTARFRLPLLLTEYALKVVAEDDNRVHLGLNLSETTSLEVFVDKHNWRIVQSLGRMQMGGMNLEFITDYSDFRRVSGVLFAHREELRAMGRPTGVATIERIEVNTGITPADFKP